jgi:hypothetical protein
MPDTEKLLPRNVAALRAGARPLDPPQLAAGNPASVLLESGVGNCFPGLECDLRNLERRFFPFIEVDTDFGELQVASVDRTGVTAARAAGTIDAATAATYAAVANSIGAPGARWRIERLDGDFGPLGPLAFDLADLNQTSFGDGRLPSDAWTAIRLLKEGTQVRITLRSPQGATRTLAAPRARYLDPNGALSTIFQVGELTQSLCSPWTHDFRDCGCYYWATNHPDIALPPEPPGGATTAAAARALQLPTVWLRGDPAAPVVPVATPAGGAPPMRYHVINRKWQELNIVLERRERLTPYVERELDAQPFANLATLIANLRFAAGVELAVMQEYLVAAWSLRLSAGTAEPLRGDLRAAFFELLQVAIGEMRHLRAVNDVLRAVGGPPPFAPALQVAARIPIGGGQTRARSFRALMPAVLAEFIAVEAPSDAVDSLYGRILVTLQAMGAAQEVVQAIRTIIAEGEDHWQTLLFVQEWLSRHQPASYLRATNPAAPGLAAHIQLQQRYSALLQTLHQGYSAGLPVGAAAVNSARSAMLGAAGLEGALEAVAATGALARFDPIADPRFAEMQPPV